VIACGIDIGSIGTKAILLNEAGEISATRIMRTGPVIKQTLEELLQALSAIAGVPTEEFNIVSTGYGRKAVKDATRVVTEITAHARGMKKLYPEVRTIIDIGGQDTKCLLLDEEGNVSDFVMNDQCAAGTGRFLEVMAGILNLTIEEFGQVALDHTKRLTINSTCTVFAESEVISLIAREESVADIAWAIHSSVVKRVLHLAGRLPSCGPVALSGGVSKNIAVQAIVREMMEGIGTDPSTQADTLARVSPGRSGWCQSPTVFVPEDPQIVGALGAASLG